MKENGYDPNTDYNGARGIARADYLLRKYGSIENIPKNSDRKPGEKKSLKDIIKIQPKFIGTFPNADSIINKYLQEAKENGYTVKKGFKRMDKIERWNYFTSFLRENDYFKQE